MTGLDSSSAQLKQDTLPTTIEVDVDGVRITALDWGGTGPAVVMLHPNGFCAGLYEPIARALTSVARPVAIDLPGHGGSDAPTDIGAYSFTSMATDVIAVLDALGIEQAAGVGGSLGGAVAIVVDQLDPGRWSRLLLAEPIAFETALFKSQGPNPMAEGARRRRRTFIDRAGMYEAYASREPMSHLAPEALEAYVRWGTYLDDAGAHLACEPETEALIFESSGGPGGASVAWDHLDELSCPTTIVVGADTFLPDMFATQAERAGADLVILPGGHFVLHEDTARGADLIAKHALEIDLPKGVEPQG